MAPQRHPRFTEKELKVMVEEIVRVEPQLFGAQVQQISIARKTEKRYMASEDQRPSKEYIWRAIAKEVRTLRVYSRRSTHCRKRWEDLRHWAQKREEAQLGMASQRGRGARRTLTFLMARILTMAYPERDGHLRTSQQPQGGEYSGYHYNLRLVGWYPDGGCVLVGTPRPGLTLQHRSSGG
ncbi:hypothetical protein NDU88_002941 [Pleurodeles waltl]|uniref:Myb/SANT-like DNA-binding domain-containing protein n=1 Tax=Pleurodeles waltl TaxID=8319 RepID=A0AAV7MQ83_PLEWA|nr:hypothetical protein NDU88_002941 [Pleurodeles waltl]